MSDLFTIDCHACGAKNTIDTETMRRVETVGNAVVTVRTEGNVAYIDGQPYTLVDGPEDAA